MEMAIGANIKRLRTAKNITQEELSCAMNVTCAAVSKWERGETYPDITLLQPLAYYFGVSIDELVGYNQEKINKDIENIIELYCQNWGSKTGREIITKAYHDYPNDYRIMYHYMWEIAGDLADNDPNVLIANKDELLTICEKILKGCTDEELRLSAWNMRAKILHAEGRTDEALEIYKTKFADWFNTSEQKTEQLFAKDTDEYYFHVQKNMYELADFAADKLGRKLFFNSTFSMEEKTKHALLYAELMLDAFDKTGEVFFLVIAQSFIGRMGNDLNFRGGTDEQIISVMDKELYAMKKLEEEKNKTEALKHWFDTRFLIETRKNLLTYIVNYRLNAKHGRRAELLKKPDYVAVLEKYK